MPRYELLRGACHRARIRATRWLAMTESVTHAFSVSRNCTGSPVDGASNSPCHITRRPRTKVPTGQPVTRTPYYGVQPAREATHLLVMFSFSVTATTEKSAS